MLSLTVYRPNSSASSVEDYLRVGVLGEDANALEDYYLEDGQADAAFVGALLPRLGVGEDYNSEDFNRLFHGEDAQGKPLTPRRTSPKKPRSAEEKPQEKPQKEASPTRRPGWDLTFSAPKSVSVAWGVASPELQRAIEQAQDQAVKTAFSYLERHFNTVSVGRGVRNEDGTFTVQTEKAKLAAATFRHGSSREQDPDLHSHLVLFNLAERADGKLLSVNGADFYARKKELGAIYRVALAHGLKELGFRIERDRFAFAISGITPEAQQHFSQRRQQIEKALAVTRYQSAKAAEQAALATREGKQDLPPELLKAQWQSRAQAYGLSAEGIEALRVGAEKSPETRPENTPENTPEIAEDPLSLTSLLQNITEFESAVKDSKVREIIATQAQGLLDVTQTEALMTRFFSAENENLVRLHQDGEAYFSSTAQQALEHDLIQTAKQLKPREHRPIRAKTVDWALQRFQRTRGFGLSAEQEQAVRHITAHTGALALVQGSAGTGKSTALEAARLAWEKRGLRVRGAALQGKAAASLSDAGINASTLASLLLKNKPWVDDSGAVVQAADPLKHTDVVVVDEAGQVDSRTLAELLTAAETAGSKVVLVGDTKQLQAVAAGGAFHALQKHAEIPVQHIDQTHRQRTPLTRAVVTHVADQQAGQALLDLLNAGRLHETEDADLALRQAVDLWANKYEKSRFDKTVIIANTNAEVAELNALARERLVDERHLEETLSVEIPVADRTGQRLGKKRFAEGDRILFRKNDKKVDVKNGDLANITHIALASQGGYDIRARKSSGQEVMFNSRDYNRFEYGYAITTHLSQGLSLDHAIIYVGEGVQNYHSSYVQVSRVKHDIDVVLAPSEAQQALLDGPPTDGMLSYAERLQKNQATPPLDLETATFLQVRDYLNKHSPYRISGGEEDTPQELTHLKDLIAQMKRQAIKQTTLDFEPGSPPETPAVEESARQAVIETITENPAYFANAVLSEKNADLSRPGLDVWGDGSIQLVTDPDHPDFGRITDTTRGYSGDLVAYLTALSGVDIGQALAARRNPPPPADGPPTKPMQDLVELILKKGEAPFLDLKTANFAQVRDYLNRHANYRIEDKQVSEEARRLKNRLLKMLPVDQTRAVETVPDTRTAQAVTSALVERAVETVPNTPKNAPPPKQPAKPYWDKERVIEAVTANPELFLDALVDEAKNPRLSRPGQIDVWGKKGSIRLVTDPSHRYFGRISDFERGYNGDIVGYIAELTGKDWYKTLADLSQQTGSGPLEPLSNAEQARRTAEKEQRRKAQAQRDAHEREKKILRAQGLWARAKPLANSLAERYLRETRGIDASLNTDAVRFFAHAKDTILDETGNYQATVTRPALLVAAHDAQGRVTAVQQIYLDPETAKKHPEAQVAKRTIGVVRGSAALIHAGGSNTVILAEGPETGASVAAARPDANVYVSLGNNRNFGQLGYLAKKHNATEILFAADNDGGKQTPSYQNLEKAAAELRQQGITVRVAMPALIEGRKTDFNDVLQKHGLDAIKDQLSHSELLTPSLTLER